MAVLVGEERVQLAVRQAGLVDAQMLTQVLREQQVLLGMQQLIPLTVVTEVLLVLGSQLLAVYAIVSGYALDTLGSRFNPLLLKKPQTQD